MPKKQYFPLLLDMVEDKVRNRFVTALFVLINYILLLFTLVITVKDPDPTVSNIK